MRLREFADFHAPALERDEARHNLILGLLGRLQESEASELRLWTLGGPGECAIQTTPRHAIILGALDGAQCRAFAEQTLDLPYRGVVGIERVAPQFVERATQLGVTFRESIPQLISSLHDAPVYPGVRGSARPVGAADRVLFADWMTAFFQEAVPDDEVPPREQLESAAAAGNYVFWIVDDVPVSMAGIVRRTRHGAAIAGVYTPPQWRGRGYAGSATASVVERAFAEGGTMACLFTDLRNPASNRCYTKIGFKPVCEAWHYLRA